MNRKKDQFAMFDVPPPFNDKPLTEVPEKVWSHETHASSEGREFLKLITEVDHLKIGELLSPDQIEAWLFEMGYEWNGVSWAPNGEGDID
jgi:hypothetical protein